MLFLNLKILVVSLGVSLVIPGKSMPLTNGGNTNLNHQYSSAETNNPVKTANSIGYKVVTNYDDGFVAAGSGGRLDWITDSGKIVKSEKIGSENINCLLSLNNELVVAGEHGAMFVSSEKGTFRKINSGTDKNINSLALFKSKIIAGTDDGEIVSGDETGSFSKINLAVKGNIVSVSAGNADCYGVTDEGEIIHTTDGTNWDIFDFNKVYDGYYKACSLIKVQTTASQISVIGKNVDGLPVLFFSSKGNVWSERPLIYTDENGFNAQLSDIPDDIYFDFNKDQFVLLCPSGKLMTIPSCSHCQKIYEISENNCNAISGNEHSIIIVGDNNYIKIINTDNL